MPSLRAFVSWAIRADEREHGVDMVEARIALPIA
jgi:hypothetical protein